MKKITLTATLSISGEEIAEIKKEGTPVLGEITNFADDFLADIARAAAAKMMLSSLQQDYPHIDVLIDIDEEYGGYSAKIDNLAGEQNANIVNINEEDPLTELLCYVQTCIYDDIRSDVIMLLLETVELAIKK